MPDTLYERYMAARNKLAKWRTVFTGWQLGTRAMSDPQAQAMRDLYDKVVGLRAEMNAVTQLLMAKGIFTETEFMTQMLDECRWLEQQYEEQFPGFKASATGMEVDTQLAAQTTKGWKP